MFPNISLIPIYTQTHTHTRLRDFLKYSRSSYLLGRWSLICLIPRKEWMVRVGFITPTWFTFSTSLNKSRGQCLVKSNQYLIYLTLGVLEYTSLFLSERCIVLKGIRIMMFHKTTFHFGGIFNRLPVGYNYQ